MMRLFWKSKGDLVRYLQVTATYSKLYNKCWPIFSGSCWVAAIFRLTVISCAATVSQRSRVLNSSSRIRELMPITEAKHHRTLMQALLFCTRLKRKDSKGIKAHKANRKQRVERICFFVCLFSSLSFCLCVFFIICLSFVQKKLGSSTGHALEWLMYCQIQRTLLKFVEFWHVFRAGLKRCGNGRLSLPVNGFYISFPSLSFGAWRWVQREIILSVKICEFKTEIQSVEFSFVYYGWSTNR